MPAQSKSFNVLFLVFCCACHTPYVRCAVSDASSVSHRARAATDDVPLSLTVPFLWEPRS